MLPTTPARRLRDAIEPLAAQAFSAAREPNKALGLRFMQGYVWGRAASMGEPTAAVVVGAFGVLDPTGIAKAYEEARAIATRADVLAGLEAGATAALERVLGDDVDVAPVGDALLGAVAGISGVARPLFSGLRALPVPSTPHGRLWRAADMVREHRGDGHLAACIAAGLDPAEMNVLTELWVGYPLGEYSASRLPEPDVDVRAAERLRRRGLLDGDELSEEGRVFRDDIEAATDRTQRELVAALGDRLEWVVEAAAALAAKVVAAGAFTSDERKRAAG